MVATKWLDNVNALFVCIYVYALSTLTYSLNIFRKKKCSKREVGSYVSRVGLSWPKKKLTKPRVGGLFVIRTKKFNFGRVKTSGFRSSQ